MTETQEKLFQCLWLTRLSRQASLGSKTVRDLLQHFPELGNLTTANAKYLADIVREPPDKVSRLLSALKDGPWKRSLQEQAVQSGRMGIWGVFSGDPEYPGHLKELSGAPLILFCRGEKALYQEIFRQAFFVTVIGTRTPTAYGRIVTERITAELAASRVVIISGLARGIDALAHRTALQKKGLTVAVVGNGPDVVYPQENAGLMGQIASSGLIVSEHPPGTPPLRQYFPARNRILSGLGDAVAVMEASGDSGTMITASYAGDQGRDVYAVPGSILSPFSQGCNQLIREGAGILESAADILWRLPGGGLQARIEAWLHSHPDNAVPGGNNSLSDQVNRSIQLKQLLAGGPLSLNEISERLGLSEPETAVILTRHEMDGTLCCERGRYSLTAKTFFCI